MATPAAAAAGAYASLARLTANAGGLAKAGAGAAGGPDFGALVKQAVNSVMETGQKADAQTKAAVTGKADVIDVVTAVSESEVAIDALVSVRDRVIRAYEDILKMPI
jgi:flagellar hook-basal body complex protein FliE